MSGPIFKNTSHSGLTVIRNGLLGIVEEQGYKDYNNFGSALHEQFLEHKKTYYVNDNEQYIIDNAIRVLNKHPLVKRLMEGSVREEKIYRKINGVELAVILDIHNKDIGGDLKTTSCRSELDFIAKAKEYGYFRQAAIYVRAMKLKMFFFIGVTKEDRPRLFIFNAMDYKEEMKYANQEIDWLLYIYANYGIIMF